MHDSAKRVLGKHVWQAGAQKSEERARLDISHYKRITDGELKAIELEANRQVMEMEPVDTQFLPRTEAEKLFGFELYQEACRLEIRFARGAGGKRYRSLRRNACHQHRNDRGHQDLARRAHSGRSGEDRVCRRRSLPYGPARSAMICSPARQKCYACPMSSCQKRRRDFFEEWKGQQKEIERLRADLAKARLKTLVAEAEISDG